MNDKSRPQPTKGLTFWYNSADSYSAYRLGADPLRWRETWVELCVERVAVKYIYARRAGSTYEHRLSKEAWGESRGIAFSLQEVDAQNWAANTSYLVADQMRNTADPVLLALVATHLKYDTSKNNPPRLPMPEDLKKRAEELLALLK